MRIFILLVFVFPILIMAGEPKGKTIIRVKNVASMKSHMSKKMKATVTKKGGLTKRQVKKITPKLKAEAKAIKRSNPAKAKKMFKAIKAIKAGKRVMSVTPAGIGATIIGKILAPKELAASTLDAYGGVSSGGGGCDP